jgi:hypothetical protein
VEVEGGHVWLVDLLFGWWCDWRLTSEAEWGVLVGRCEVDFVYVWCSFNQVLTVFRRAQ